LSCPYTSQQNGKAKRILRTVNDCVRNMLIHAGMPSAYWAEALAAATHFINRRPCHTSGTSTPYQLLLGEPPSYNHLRVFGCLCFPNQAATTPNKLSACSVPCAFLGYPSYHRGYRCLDLRTRRVITSRHVTFDETQFPFHSEQLQSVPTTTGSATVCDETIILPTIAIQAVPPEPGTPPVPTPPNSASPNPPSSSQSSRHSTPTVPA
jgi:histone deacetylase 1/2